MENKEMSFEDIQKVIDEAVVDISKEKESDDILDQIRPINLNMKNLVKEINLVYDSISELLAEKGLPVAKSMVKHLPWFMAEKLEKQTNIVAVEEIDTELEEVLIKKKESYESILKNIFSEEDKLRELLKSFYLEDNYEFIHKNLKEIPNCSEKVKLVKHLNENYKKTSYI